MLYHSPNHHFRQHHYLKHKELDSLYGSYFIKLFAESFISVFTAIFLLSLGFSVAKVALYYIIYFIFAYLAGFVARYTMQRAGVVKTLGLGIIGYVVYYFFLQQITSGVPFELVAIIYGVASGLYFSAFNVELAHALKKSSSEGSAVANIRIIAVAASIIGPLVGAVFISQFSFQLLFTLVALLLLVSLMPLFSAGDYRLKLPKFSPRRILKQGNPRWTAVFALNGAVASGLDILWPIFIYLNFKNFIAVGGIVSATALIMTVVIYTIGRFSDLHNAASFRTGVLSHAPTWLIRLTLLTPGGLLLSNLLSSLTAYLIDIPFHKAVYHTANKSPNTADYFLYSAFYTMIGRVLILGCAVIIQNLIVVFILISVLTLAHLMLLPELKINQATPLER